MGAKASLIMELHPSTCTLSALKSQQSRQRLTRYLDDLGAVRLGNPMGIPRLTQDLASYVELKQVGCGSAQSRLKESIAENWVLDGPSVIYHVYGDLLANRGAISASRLANLPTYQEVNAAVHAYLATLQSHGIHVKAVFFDGSLPTAKRQVRLERLEKTRVQLERFRMGNTEYPLYLPPLPFIVASAIESFQTSESVSRVHVVSEEADVACARVAAKEAVSILTNDSDLALFPMLPESRIVWLHSLETSLQSDGNTKLQASCLVPSKVAARLNLPDLLRLGFERQLDPSITTAVALDRAKRGLRDQNNIGDYSKFCEQYFSARADGLPFNFDVLDPLDPRTAEYVLQVSTSVEKPFVYLPILHEDPSRDASWAYGIDIRQLAYSIANQSFPATAHAITEIYRKGQRIGHSSVEIMSCSEITVAATSLLQSIKSHGIDATAPVITWWCLALSIISRSKIARGQRVDKTIIRALFGLGENQSEGISWEYMHLHANLQAALYSLRMMKQILTYLSREQVLAKAIGPKVSQLLEALDGMQSMEALFLDIGQLRSSMYTSGGGSTITVLGSEEGIMGVDDNQKDAVAAKVKGVKSDRRKARSESSKPRNGFSVFAPESESDDESADNKNRLC